ncbi:TraR/DksA C4-type zinc finger protein [Patulibacter sp.]|uniref:TraR/DksA family transcriptional regulator n=1 Tax=Patulibacter sp. TaxID=1912859 RepID=UPI002719437C|nr:TraR/DksA C4-type zinc finger protein [Patulibacter sp.]MDO9407342.1 TraR/DksA C4-type zinc finger protein [Patulibacter sp.]
MVRRSSTADATVPAPDLDEVRTALQARADDLRSRIGVMAAAPERGSTLSFGKRIGDGTLEAVGRLTEVGVGASLELEEARVSRALEKLDDGTYGLCDACGRPIAPKRLRAMPESVLCLEDAAKLRR